MQQDVIISMYVHRFDTRLINGYLQFIVTIYCIMNTYTKDSILFFRKVSKEVSNSMDEFQVIQLTLNLALGLERLIKGILYDINPLYILIEPSFEHSIRSLYSGKIIAEVRGDGTFKKAMNEDVITFRNSLIRAKVISQTCYDFSNILFNISEARDIIVQHELNRLKIDDLKLILLKDYYTLMKRFASETGLDLNEIFESDLFRVSELSGNLQIDFELRIKLLLERHAESWNKNFEHELDDLTERRLRSSDRESITCPSCNNTAVLNLKTIYEYNFIEGQDEAIGKEVKSLRCYYCNLEIFDSVILDYLGIHNRKIEESEL